MADRDPWETAPAASASAPAERDPWEKPAVQAQGGMSWADVGKQAVRNIPSSAVELGKNIVQPFLHPIDTATAIKDVGQGALQKAGILGGEDKKAHADAVGQFFMERYGGMENLKKTMAKDPVGFLADASMLLTGGESALGRVPGIVGETAQAVGKVGRAVDPLTTAGKGLKAGANLGSDVLGLGTGVGGESIRIAAGAGREGGEALQATKGQVRQIDEARAPVDDMRSAMRQIRAERGAEYRKEMASVKENRKVLSFDKVDESLADISQVQTFHGQVLDPETQAIRQKIGEAIAEWKVLPKEEFHTPEGLDALKRRIGSIRDTTQYGTTENKIANEAYHAVRDTIVKEDPKYGEVMKAYEKASETIEELDKTLSANPNATIDTSLRKLQSVLRNNVSSNYGQRKVLAEYLVDHGAPHLLERLAGQSLSSIEPRGFAKLVAQGLAAIFTAGEATGHGPGLSALAGLPLMSPRFVGEAAMAAGQASRLVKHPKAMARGAFQTGRIEDYLRKKGMVQ